MTAPISKMDVGDGRQAWVVGGYDDVVELLTSPLMSIQPTAGTVRSWFEDTPMNRVLARLAERAIPESATAAQERGRRRDSVRGSLGGVRAAAIEPDVVGIAKRLADDVAALTPPVDLGPAYIEPLCTQVACALLGVPEEDAQLYRRWAADKDGTDQRRAMLSLREMNRYVAAQLSRAHEEPRNDVVGHLVALPDSDDTISGEIITWILSLGWTVPADALRLGLRLLLAEPAERDRLRADPAGYDAATEEVLRLFRLVPEQVGGIDRFPVADMEFRGVTFAKDDLVVLDLSAANRDERVFTDPARFDPRREVNPHLTFGRGAYYCHFSGVARQELTVGLRVLIERLPGLALAPDQPTSARGISVVWTPQGA
ncbi:MAG: cytochrome P450 [Hamadaea sp.]|nr:cytochrome P450 [Hamadaea sp.]